jgi:hydroxymethylglutaryl-CoA lyase
MAADTVKLIECPRDAWQGLNRLIPTEIKVSYLRGLIAAGFTHIDAVSFVSPKTVPQMADSEEVLARLQPSKDIEIIGIVVNEKGAQRAIATGAVATLGYPCSTSATFLRKNQNQSQAENLQVLEAIRIRAAEANLNIVVYISMAFGNPYGDPWDEAQLGKAIQRIADLRIRTISLADTVGLATAELITRTLNSVIRDHGDIEIGVHMHSAKPEAITKVLAAYNAGCRRFDSAIGGLGGCPFAQDILVGNIPTESVIEALKQRGVEVPLVKSIEQVVQLNNEIARSYA